MASSRNPIRPLAALSALLLSVALAGCDPVGDVQPEERRAVNLGLNVDVAEIELGNFLIVTRGAGETARLMGSLLNPTDSEVEVTFTDSDDEVTVTLLPGQQYAFQENETFFDTADEPPGARTQIEVSAEGDSVVADVPVRDGSLDWLEPYIPPTA